MNDHEHVIVNVGDEHCLVTSVVSVDWNNDVVEVNTNSSSQPKLCLLDDLTPFLRLCSFIHYPTDLDVMTFLNLDTVNLSFPDGKTPLHLAIEKRNSSLVNQLLSAGASIFVTAEDGRSTIHRAVLSGNYDILETLLEQAKKSSELSFGNFSDFINQKDTENLESPLFLAAHYWMYAHTEADFGVSRLVFSRMFDLIAGFGGDVTTRNVDKMTILHLPAYHDADFSLSLEMATHLITNYPVCKNLVNIQDKDTETPFHTLFKTQKDTLLTSLNRNHSYRKNKAVDSFLNLVFLFRKIGGKVSTIKTTKGYTALDLAFDKGPIAFEHIFRTLEDADAEVPPADPLVLSSSRPTSPPIFKGPTGGSLPRLPKLKANTNTSKFQLPKTPVAQRMTGSRVKPAFGSIQGGINKPKSAITPLGNPLSRIKRRSRTFDSL
ncbi:hypothetical protein P9112_012314 [Eukaryota sp. TZLM1-RC]